MFQDLRQFIAHLEAAGELQRVPASADVDWKYEAGGWVQRMAEARPRGPALLFEGLRGYPEGHRLFSGGLNSYGRIATIMGLPADAPPLDLVRAYKDAIRNPVAPRMVDSGPVKEHVHVGDDVNVLELPVPWWHPRDGGRYIATWHGCVTKDRETGIRNVGLYRMMILDERHCAVGFLPYSHMGRHFTQRAERGEPLEMALVIGAEETLPMAAMTGVPLGYDEYGLVGSLRGGPLELVKCETVDLEVPARAEIVIEGRIHPYERVPEGPLSEHAGYHSSGVRMRPVFEITAILHRDRPIFRGYLNTKPATESHLVKSICLSAAGLAMFESNGPDGVSAVFCPPEADPCSMAFIQMSPRYVGHSLNAGRAFLSSCSAATYHKLVVVVDPDIDITNYGDILWALATRTQGSRDYEVLRFGTASRTDPSIPASQGEYTDKVIIDATKKLDYPFVPMYGGHWAPVARPPEEVMQLAELKAERLAGVVSAAGDAEIGRLAEHLRTDFDKRWTDFRREMYYVSPEQQEAELARSYPGLAAGAVKVPSTTSGD